MYHPALGDAQVIEVNELAVPHHRAAGWLPVGEKPETEEKTTITNAPRKSRSTKE